MTGSIALILSCLLLGELVSQSLNAPLPGAVVGMLILLGWQGWWARPTPNLDAISTGLITYLPLMFVPAAVGLMQQGPALSQHGLAFGLALLVSSISTLGVTALVFRALTPAVAAP